MQTPEIPDRIRELAQKWLEGKSTPEEQQEFNDWYNQFNDEQVELPASPQYARSTMERRIWEAIAFQTGIPHKEKVKGSKGYWVRYAAALIALVALGILAYVLFRNPVTSKTPKTMTQEITHPSNEVLPGGDRATLLLGNGTQLLLDSSPNGHITDEGGTSIIKVKDGQLAYTHLENADDHFSWNTLQTPKGGQYALVLPDGSRVWLNAVSRLRFPTRFTGHERMVELEGEAYFEITPDAQKPFHVKVNDMQVTVLGTHFNIMAYPNETAILTTLLEGSVNVTRGSAQTVLQPGQQASVDKATASIRILSANTEQAVAWKNGFIYLSNAEIPFIMRQIERWYDVEVRYPTGKPAGTLSGKVLRNLTLSQMLRAMEASGIHFKLEGRTLLVYP